MVQLGEVNAFKGFIQRAEGADFIDGTQRPTTCQCQGDPRFVGASLGLRRCGARWRQRPFVRGWGDKAKGTRFFRAHVIQCRWARPEYLLRCSRSEKQKGRTRRPFSRCHAARRPTGIIRCTLCPSRFRLDGRSCLSRRCALGRGLGGALGGLGCALAGRLCRSRLGSTRFGGSGRLG